MFKQNIPFIIAMLVIVFIISVVGFFSTLILVVIFGLYSKFIDSSLLKKIRFKS